VTQLLLTVVDGGAIKGFHFSIKSETTYQYLHDDKRLVLINF